VKQEGGHAKEKNIHFKMIEVGAGKAEAGFVAVDLPSGFDLRQKLVVRGAYSLLAEMTNSEEEHTH
jgi:hypothetical protein